MLLYKTSRSSDADAPKTIALIKLTTLRSESGAPSITGIASVQILLDVALQPNFQMITAAVRNFSDEGLVGFYMGNDSNVKYVKDGHQESIQLKTNTVMRIGSTRTQDCATVSGTTSLGAGTLTPGS